MKHYHVIRAVVAAAVLAASAAVSASAASFTVINTASGEPSLFTFLDAVYGAGNYERISDDVDGLWVADDLIGITAVGKMSAAYERLGVCVICDGSDSHQFGPAVTPNGVISLVLFDGVFSFDAPSFRWYDAAFQAPPVGTVYSDSTLNAGGTDHMVSFAIKDRPGVFVIAFEDWLSDYPNGSSDRDFNDFIVETRFSVQQTVLPPYDEQIPAVPEPTSIALLGGSLLLLGLVERSRRRRA